MKKFDEKVNKNDFDLGASYTKEYISFCITNYVYDFNLIVAANFVSDLIDFIKGAPSIPNKENLTFKEFCENYSLKE